ncbi:MAG: MMPL family transporter [candidate division FCPU426 bacterium]
MLERFSRFVIRHAKLMVALSLLATLGFGYQLRYLKINSDVLTSLPQDDPVIKTFNQVGETYGGNALAIVAVEADDIFTPGTLASIRDLTNRFRAIPGVISVASLTHVIDIHDTDGQIEISQLIDENDFPRTPAACQALKTRALSKTLLRGRLVSEDGRLTLIVCRLLKDKEKVSSRIRAEALRARVPEKLYFTGMPFQSNEIYRFIVSDLMVLIPIIAVVMSLALFLSFRTLHGIWLPLLAVGISTLWTLGMMSLLRVPLSIFSNIIPVVLMAVGSAYSIHVISHYHESGASLDPEERAVGNLKDVGVPVILAAVTTMIGFASFIFGSYLTMIKEFGAFVALGIGFALFNSLTLVPALLYLIHPQARRPHPSADGRLPGPGRLSRFWAGLVVRHRAGLLAAFGLIAVVCSLFIPRIDRRVDFLDYFKPGSEIRKAENIIGRYFGGSVPTQVIVRGDIQDPDVLAAMAKMQEELKRQPELRNPQSIVDYLVEMNAVMGEGRRLPDTREKVANLWFLLEGEEVMSQLVNPDASEAIIQAVQKSAFSRQNSQMVEQIQAACRALGSDKVSFELTSQPVIFKKLDDSLMRSQRSSMSLALGFIVLCLVLMLRSLKNGLLSALPIAFSLLVMFGFMGAVRIPLDVATVLLASITIGIGVDYSIHFANRLQREQGLGYTPDPEQLLARALSGTGKAIWINVVTVAAGFLVLVFSNLVPIQRFGILVALTMLSSGLGAIAIIPVLLLPGQKRPLAPQPAQAPKTAAPAEIKGGK